MQADTQIAMSNLPTSHLNLGARLAEIRTLARPHVGICVAALVVICLGGWMIDPRLGSSEVIGAVLVAIPLTCIGVGGASGLVVSLVS